MLNGVTDAFFNPTKYKSVLLSYTQFLNLDTTAIMIRYADAMQNAVSKERNENGVCKAWSCRHLW